MAVELGDTGIPKAVWLIALAVALLVPPIHLAVGLVCVDLVVQGVTVWRVLSLAEPKPPPWPPEQGTAALALGRRSFIRFVALATGLGAAVSLAGFTRTALLLAPACALACWQRYLSADRDGALRKAAGITDLFGVWSAKSQFVRADARVGAWVHGRYRYSRLLLVAAVTVTLSAAGPMGQVVGIELQRSRLPAALKLVAEISPAFGVLVRDLVVPPPGTDSGGRLSPGRHLSPAPQRLPPEDDQRPSSTSARPRIATACLEADATQFEGPDVRREVSAAMASVWREAGAAIAGCAASPPQRVGKLWVSSLRHGEADPVRVISTDEGDAAIVWTAFLPILERHHTAIRRIESRVSFEAGEFQVFHLPRGCLLGVRFARRDLAHELPASVTEIAVEAARRRGGIPVIVDDSAPPDPEFIIGILRPTVAPAPGRDIGYALSGGQLTIRFDPRTGRATGGGRTSEGATCPSAREAVADTARAISERVQALSDRG